MCIDGNKGHITEKAKDSSQAKPSVLTTQETGCRDSGTLGFPRKDTQELGSMSQLEPLTF